jgi:glycosyltransferase involved in cell wall biosynthesis
MRRYGGTYTFFKNYCENFPTTKDDVIILDQTADQPVLDFANKQQANILYFPKLKGSLLFNRTIHNIYLLFKLKQLHKEKEIDQVIFADWNIIFDFFSLLINRPVVSFVHTYPERELPSFLKKMNSFLSKNMKLITVSDYSRKKMNDNWFSTPQDISIIYNFSERRNINKSHYQTCNFITISHCEPYKDPESWIEVAREVCNRNKKVSFIWVGDGALYEKCKKETEVDERIHFVGYKEDVEEWLKDTFVYLQFSKRESLGISILDALKQGIPSVVANVGGMPEVVSHDETGFIGNSKEEYVKYIQHLINNPEVYAQFSQNAKDRYERVFSKKRWIEQMKEHLNK